MRYFLLSVITLTCLAVNSNAQILTRATSPSTIANEIPGYSQVSVINTKLISYTPSTPPTPPTPIDEDTTTEDSKLYRYGDNLTVYINNSDGNITTTSVGKVWTLRISIPTALNIGFTFYQMNLSSAAEMYIFNEARTVLKGAIKLEQFSNINNVGISSLKGNSIIIYIVEPNNFGTFQSNILIQKVIAGFREIDDVGETGGGNQSMRASINCNPHVQCQQGRMQTARAVARFNTNGHQCTGTLINNEANNGRAFFLTAFHCIDVGGGLFGGSNGTIDPDEEAALADATFQFQFWRTQCNGTVNNNGIEFSGAVLRAAWRNSDVVLLELIRPPGIGDAVNYAGYSRQTDPPSKTQSLVLHHPEGADMRVTSTRNVKHFFWNNMFWTAHYSSGTVTGGSSGAALFNEYGQIVGQLRGGWSNCNFTDFGDRYGKFNHSWNGAGLQQWLSPNQGLQATATLDLTNIPINGPDMLPCTTSGTFTTLPGLLDVTYEWVASNNMQVISGQSTHSASIRFINNSASTGTVTLILRSPTKGWNRIYTISKTVTYNSGSILGYYNSPTASSTPMQPFSRFQQIVNDACVGEQTNCSMSIPSGSQVTWSGPDPSSGITWYQIGNNLSFYLTELDQEAVFSISVTNSCGNKILNYKFKGVYGSCGGTPLRLMVSPNPSSGGMMQATLVEINDNSKKKDILSIKILDRMGNIKSITNYGQGIKTASLNVSTLGPDIYTILAFDGVRWIPARFIKN